MLNLLADANVWGRKSLSGSRMGRIPLFLLEPFFALFLWQTGSMASAL
jgi:hypothetical protein